MIFIKNKITKTNYKIYSQIKYNSQISIPITFSGSCSICQFPPCTPSVPYHGPLPFDSVSHLFPCLEPIYPSRTSFSPSIMVCALISLLKSFSPEVLFHFQIMSVFLKLLVLFLWLKVAHNFSWVYAFDISTCCVLDPVMILVVAYVADLYIWGTIRIFNVAYKIFCVEVLKSYISWQFLFNL